MRIGNPFTVSAVKLRRVGSRNTAGADAEFLFGI